MFLEQQADWDKSEKKANIPVPPIVIIEDYDKSVSKDYVRPASYLRYKRKFHLLDSDSSFIVEIRVHKNPGWFQISFLGFSCSPGLVRSEVMLNITLFASYRAD